MKETEICRKYMAAENSEKRTISYCILSECGDQSGFGVRIRVLETGERCDAPDLTQYRYIAEKVLDMMATGFVTPVSMPDIIEDWLGR